MIPTGGGEPSPPSASSADTGEGAEANPRVAELATLAVEPSPAFVRRVRHRIHRRVLTSQVLDLSSAGVWQVAVEFLGMAFGLVERAHQTRGPTRGHARPTTGGRASTQPEHERQAPANER